MGFRALMDRGDEALTGPAEDAGLHHAASFGSNPHGAPRTPEQIAAWDAVTVVHGTANTDATADTGYTVEMRFDLNVIGYDVTRPQGDVIEFFHEERAN